MSESNEPEALPDEQPPPRKTMKVRTTVQPPEEPKAIKVVPKVHLPEDLDEFSSTKGPWVKVSQPEEEAEDTD